MKRLFPKNEYLARLNEQLHGAWHELTVGAPVARTVPVEYSGELPKGLSFLIGTSQGLLVWSDDELHKLLPGPIYGVTRHGQNHYALQRLGKSSRIIRFSLADDADGLPAVVSLETFIHGLSNGVHQIDFIGDVLYVTDTYHNALQLHRVDGSFVDRIYPAGKLTRDDIFTPCYRHYNSVYWDGERILLVAHNNSLKAGRPSLIQFVGHSEPQTIIDEWEDIGLCAHNVLRKEGVTFWCDSLNSYLYKDKTVVAEMDMHLTRGLAMDDRHLVLGGSAFAFGSKRLKADGKIYVLDSNNFTNLGELNLKAVGAVSEIRMLGHDYGLSNCNLPDRVAEFLPR